MSLSFERCIRHVIMVEGGERLNLKEPAPHDASKFGITRVTLEEFRGVPCTVQDVIDLTETEAVLILKARYWDKLNLDLFQQNWVAQAMLLDQGINRGIYGVAREVTYILNKVFGGTFPADGQKITLEIIAFIDKIPPMKFFREYKHSCHQSYNQVLLNNVGDYEKLKQKVAWIKGWTIRLKHLEDFILSENKLRNPLSIC